MKHSRLIPTLAVLSLALPALAQTRPEEPQTTLRINSRAVLVDVIVTDRSGKPVTGLNKEAFTVSEQGAPQAIDFFEEHRGLSPDKAARLEYPQLPPDVFSNFSPIAAPPAVNILLIDALNTPMTDQAYLRKMTQQYLKSLKPGSRLAIFIMGMRLHFVEGFSDDPVVLARALGYQKNDKPEPAVLLQSQEESTAQSSVIGLMNQFVGAGAGALTNAAPAAMITSFEQFLQENQYAQTSDREYRTLSHLQQLASYLAAFPGRKNLIWLSGAFPLDLFGLTDMRFEENTQKTVNLLAAARVALYPVDCRGAWTQAIYAAETPRDPSATTPQQMVGPAMNYAPPIADPSNINSGGPTVTVTSGGFDHARTTEGMQNGVSNTSMDMVAADTGGKAFYNQNDLARIIDKVVSSSSNFYTIAYTPSDMKMNGAFRKIAVRVPGGQYTLAYRHGYYAREQDKPGAAQDAQKVAIQQASNGIDPLQPFMDFGLPQTEQILYKARIVPSPSSNDSAQASRGPHDRYGVDFAVDLKDLNLVESPDGQHKGTLVLSLIVYNKYGDILNRRDHRVVLDIKPDVWKVFQQTGVQLHADVDVPKSEQCWLRTGIYDESSHKVGTMEVPFSSVRPLQASAAPPEGVR